VLPWHAEQLARHRVCLVCAEGYSSSLAAALLVELGVDAGDLIGGFAAMSVGSTALIHERRRRP
jgi:rhodanese-related sulfurtransferase